MIVRKPRAPVHDQLLVTNHTKSFLFQIVIQHCLTLVKLRIDEPGILGFVKISIKSDSSNSSNTATTGKRQ